MIRFLQKLSATKLFSHLHAISKRSYADICENSCYKLSAVPALEDNYMYVLINPVSRQALAIDPVEPEKVLAVLKQANATLSTVLTTHHHYDHCGGNEYISKKLSGISIYGGDDRIESLTHKVRHGDRLKINSFDIECLFTPCHTSGHMCYHVRTDHEPPVCFTGDTLFIAGCGRFFEGTAEHMLSALNRLSKLPSNTLVCCGHEYTVSNLKFAIHVEPSNVEAQNKLSWSLNMRKEKKPTVPSTIGEELSYNPFMRVHENEVRKFTGQSDPVEVMAELRKLKDQFKVM